MEENSFRLYIQKIVPVKKRANRSRSSDRFLDTPSDNAGSHRLRPQLSQPEPENSFAGCHYEVLLRSLDPAGNLIAPGVFLLAAERYGLMPAIDRWVITTFLSGYEVYCQLEAERHLEPVSNLYAINLSGASINSEFAHFLQEQFDRYRIPPATICFEITETVAISNLDSAIALMEQLKELGCSIALDDFGSGMSSLTYLKNLPIDYLKIDGSLIVNLANDEIDYATVECFNYISQMMKIKTVAEFVENQAVLGKLESIGIDYAQGYAIERPHSLVWN